MATSKYPYDLLPEMFKEQRTRLAASMASAGMDATACAFFQGGAEIPRNSSDTNYPFRQESYFQYLFGHEAPDCQGAVFPDGTAAFFIPRLPESYGVWMGPLPTPELILRLTGIDECHYTDEAADVLAKRGVKAVHVMQGANDDSGLTVLRPDGAPFAAFAAVKDDWLFNVLTEQRVFKTRHETDVLTWANKISSEAHIVVMQKVQPGMNQRHLEATFWHHCFYYGGMRQMSYSCICATGEDGAVLHHIKNDRDIQDGSMALLDMGGEYHCYATDITCSFPINGKFTPAQRGIYEAVLAAQAAVFKAMKPGVPWVDMHKLALTVMAGAMVKMGFFAAGVTVDAIMDAHLMRLFQPHGLGHLIGLDVHDVGGYLPGTPERPTRPDLCKIRTSRVLRAGMFITVEPGIYFNHVLLEKALANPDEAKMLNEAKLSEFADFGGVRIEDNVIVTEDGILNLTCCPRTVDEVEATMAGKAFDKGPQKFCA